MKGTVLCATAAVAAAHSNLIYPKPRNAIDSDLPEWSGGKAPYLWQPHGDAPCACRNGTSGAACEVAQTCLWMSVGCSIGCDACDGGQDGEGGTNPNLKDRCPGVNPDRKTATINNPLHRTFNRGAVAGSDADWTRFNPWRAPGSAPVFDPCGRAGGGPVPTGGHGEYTNTTHASFGDMGSKVLPKYPSGAVWKAGATVETIWSVRANHGGGWQYRLCPLEQMPCTEAQFQQLPMDFAADSKMLMSNGTMLDLASTFVTDGTLPVGGTWQMLPIPMTRGVTPEGKWSKPSLQFPAPCYDPTPPESLGQGICTGEWMTNITMYDYLAVPKVPAGEYVMSFRWDCESSAQVWQSCADVTITD